jgi:MFS family permease
MVDALRLFANIPFAVFMFCSMLICIPLAYYYGYTSNYLSQTGFEAPASTMTLGQMSEIVFMLLIPFFFRRLGVKWMILIGMGAWVARYLLFAFGAPDQVAWMLLLGVLLHGVCYDFFFVTGFMYTDKKANHEIRGQAQSMLVFFTQGIGMFIGYEVADDRFGKTVTQYKPLVDEINAKTPESTLTFAEQFGRMFAMNRPDGVNQELFAQTMDQWKEFWIVPAIMAGVILLIFAASFWDRSADDLDADAADETSELIK